MQRWHDRDWARLLPLMLATMASQALLVVLAPTIAAIAADFRVSVGAVGQARSVAAVVAIAVSAAIARRIDTVPTSRLLSLGATAALAASGAVAVTPSLTAFLLAHVLVGVALACLLSAGFAGAAALSQERRARAVGLVAGGNALAWIVVNPIVAIVADRVSWRAAEAVPAAIALAALAAAPLAASAPTSAALPGLRTLLRQRSARRWIGAETIAYGAWTSLLTFVGAFFVERLGVRGGAVGWLLAAGAAFHFVASTRRRSDESRLPRRRLVAAVALAMAVLLVVELHAGSIVLGAATFCLLGFAAGVRMPASAELGLAQLPGHPGAMMTARTAATQVGYLAGALVGGVFVAGPGYGALGLVLGTAMAASAWLILRVDDPLERVARRSSSRVEARALSSGAGADH